MLKEEYIFRGTKNFVRNLPMPVVVLTLEVKWKKSLEDKLVGTAKLPLSDFIGSYIPDGHSNFLNYLLRDSRGKKSGIINVSVGVKLPACTPLYKHRRCRDTSVHWRRLGILVGLTEKNLDGTVTRIPVWNPNQI